VDLDDAHDSYVSGTAKYTRAMFRSAAAGSRSNNTIGGWTVQGKAPAKEITTTVTFETYSRAAWLMAAGLQPEGKSGQHSVIWGFVTDGTSADTTNKNTGESNGKLAAGNLTAQVFGLYWYEGCNNAENNWSVGDVRMRMFNPSYVLTNSKWLLTQPRQNGSSMGGLGRLALPELTPLDMNIQDVLFAKERQLLRLENWICPFDAFHSTKKQRKTTEAHPLGGGRTLEHYVMSNSLGASILRASELHRVFGDVVFRSDEYRHVGIDMGFRCIY